jgi:hypothetical protein
MTLTNSFGMQRTISPLDPNPEPARGMDQLG